MKRRNFLVAMPTLPILLHQTFLHKIDPPADQTPTESEGTPFGMDEKALDGLYCSVAYPDPQDFSKELIIGPFIDGWNAWRFVKSLQIVKSKSSYGIQSVNFVHVDRLGMAPHKITLDMVCLMTISNRRKTLWHFTEESRAQEFVSKFTLRPYYNATKKKYAVVVPLINLDAETHPHVPHDRPLFVADSEKECQEWMGNLCLTPTFYMGKAAVAISRNDWINHVPILTDAPIFLNLDEALSYLKKMEVVDLDHYGNMGEVYWPKTLQKFSLNDDAKKDLICNIFEIPKSLLCQNS